MDRWMDGPKGVTLPGPGSGVGVCSGRRGRGLRRRRVGVSEEEEEEEGVLGAWCAGRAALVLRVEK